MDVSALTELGAKNNNVSSISLEIFIEHNSISTLNNKTKNDDLYLVLSPV